MWQPTGKEWAEYRAPQPPASEAWSEVLEGSKLSEPDSAERRKKAAAYFTGKSAEYGETISDYAYSYYGAIEPGSVDSDLADLQEITSQAAALAKGNLSREESAAVADQIRQYVHDECHIPGAEFSPELKEHFVALLRETGYAKG